ncbi:ATP-binding protein [Effusibacillus lacus]|uniref:ATP-binding protein n=1 Tax=Effusibacillus lacus TaxID=1348429 RepID=A0A292YJ70_9BACL|nr:ATP-binding protein [Effusibacillus lacus]TCS76816.1 serine/threonine-protein kinase RsbW [Effusibacillus lacus]GAX91147.1 ATP-binding protein [Effusibacillus lacus]
MEQKAKKCIQTSFPSRLGTEKTAMELIEPFLQQAGASLSRLEDIKTLVSEACLNAIEHGNAMDERKSYRLELQYEDNCLTIRVEDEGGRSRWSKSPQFQPIDRVMETDGEPRGWGLQIIDQLADAWQYHVSDHGTRFEITVNMQAEGGGGLSEYRS